MATSKKLTGKKSNGQQSSQAATPVNRSAKQANAKARKTRDTFGHGYEQPLANYDLTTQSWKTSEDISLWGELKSLERLPKSGMTRNGVLYQQPDWERPIDEIASSLLPTPTVGDLKYRLKGTTQASKCLAAMAGNGKLAMWPTPQVDDSKNVNPSPKRRKSLVSEVVKRQQWPTPMASGGGGSGHWQMIEKKYLDGQITYEEKMAMQAGPRGVGKLNPTWVEWLMGFPIGWTDLED